MKNAFSVLRSKGAKVATAISALALTAGANAASVLPSTYAADMTSIQTDILTVGGSIIGLCVVALGFRWIKATFF